MYKLCSEKFSRELTLHILQLFTEIKEIDEQFNEKLKQVKKGQGEVSDTTTGEDAENDEAAAPETGKNKTDQTQSNLEFSSVFLLL